MPIGSGKLHWRQDGNQTLAVTVDRRDSYPIIVGRGKLATLPRLVKQVPACNSVVIITDERVGELWLQRSTDLLTPLDLTVQSIVIPAGEVSKSWAVAELLLSSLSSGGALRRTTLLALGGGVLCDLVGFVASMFMRGLPYINIPTSLMAQLDGSIGGKTGIDFSGSKNLVGTFYHPTGVLVDPDLLATLPAREIRSGLAEAVKVGIIFPTVFAQLERLTLGTTMDFDALAAIILDSITYKMDLLQEDPFEHSLERLLNLGHTFAHAVEAASGFNTYRHGEAVAIGIALATAISHGRGLCEKETEDRILSCLSVCGLGVTLPASLVDSSWREVDMVRRIRNGNLHEVLPVSIGECRMVNDITYEEYRSAVRSLNQHPSRAVPGSESGPR
jgi:3-dehydroquinate synthase